MANIKITQLPTASQANLTDIIEKVDVTGTPTNQRLTLQQVKNLIIPTTVASSSWAQSSISSSFAISASSSVTSSFSELSNSSSFAISASSIFPDVIAKDISFTSRVGTPFVTFIFEDSLAFSRDLYKPIFDERGISANIVAITSFVSSGNSSSYWNISDLLDAQNNHGWQVINGTVTHPHLASLTLDSASLEINNARSYLLSQGLTASVFSYPYSEYNDNIRYIVRQNHTAGFGPSSTTAAQGYISTIQTDIFGARNLSDSSSLSSWKANVQTAITNSLWASFFCETTSSNLTTSIASLIDFCLSNSVSIGTVDQALNFNKNIIDNVNFYVTNKGHMYANYSRFKDVLADQNVTAGPTGYIQFTARTALSTPADGTLYVTKNDGTTWATVKSKEIMFGSASHTAPSSSSLGIGEAMVTLNAAGIPTFYWCPSGTTVNSWSVA